MQFDPNERWSTVLRAESTPAQEREEPVMAEGI